jgi:ketosteroid isomerase-like protein
MAQDNVQALRDVFEAFNSGDLGRVIAFTHPDFEGVVPPELSAEPDIYRGHDGIRRYFQSFEEAMTEIRFHADRLWDAGESVAVAARLTAKGRQTAISVEQQFVLVWTFRDGMAIRVQAYVSLPEALESVGIAEE